MGVTQHCWILAVLVISIIMIININLNESFYTRDNDGTVHKVHTQYVSPWYQYYHPLSIRYSLN